MVVLPDGTVGDVRITQWLDPGLNEESVKAARQWVFEPGTRFGEPVAVRVNRALDFNLRYGRGRPTAPATSGALRWVPDSFSVVT